MVEEVAIESDPSHLDSSSRIEAATTSWDEQEAWPPNGILFGSSLIPTREILALSPVT